ncbi:MAG: 4'-phosphopantetheinyl transferase superfamily protein [Prevotella sp.]|nr:4'-phosphopantetheinyl transferase superfamily protein [Prevotella sp.]
MELIESIIARQGFAAFGASIIERIADIPDAEIDTLLASLPAWRRQEATAISNKVRRRENILSFALLTNVLRREFGIREELEFDYGAHEKPFLKRHPEIFFNISHCREAVAVIAGKTPVGIDIERRGRYKKALAEEVLSKEELAGLNNAPDADLEFTKLWTRKEAILKLTGEGVGIKMRSAVSDHPEIALRTFCRGNYVCSTAVTA